MTSKDHLPVGLNFVVADKLAYPMQKYPEIKFIEEALNIAKGASSLVDGEVEDYYGCAGFVGLKHPILI